VSELRVTEKGIAIEDGVRVVSRWHWLHRWTEWQTVREGEIGHVRTNAILYHFKDQERHCAVCNKLEARHIRS
jgi:hypothetical protein